MGAKAKAKQRGEPSIKGRAMPPLAREAGGKDARADGNGERKCELSHLLALSL